MQARSRLRNVLKKFPDISFQRFVGVVKFAADSMTEDGITLEKFKIM